MKVGQCLVDYWSSKLYISQSCTYQVGQMSFGGHAEVKQGNDAKASEYKGLCVK